MQNEAPNHRDFSAIVFLLGAALLLAVLAIHLHLTDSSPFLDEGCRANTGRMLAQGKAMYRDAFNETGPGIYWVTAGLFRVFGDRFTVVRYMATADMLAVLVLLLALGARTGKPLAGLIGAGCFASWHLFFLGRLWEPESLLTPLLLAPLYLLAAKEDQAASPPWKYLAAGLLYFLATVIKQTTWLAVGLIFLALLVSLRRRTRVFAWTRLGALAAGVAAPWIAVLATTYRQGVLEVFLNGYLFPLRQFGVVSYFCAPTRPELFISLPFWWMAAVTLAHPAMRRAVPAPTDRRLLSATLLATVAMIFPAMFAHHFLPPLAPAALGFGLALTAPDRRGRLLGLLPFLLLCAPAAWFAPEQYQTRVGRFEMPQWRQIAARVEARTAPDDPLFVFPHDSTFYYLTKRQPPGPTGFLMPWTAPPAVLDEFLGEFQVRPPRVILYTYLENCTPRGWPPRDYLGPFLTLLTEHYQVAEIFDNRVVLLAPREPGANTAREACRLRNLFYGVKQCGQGSAAEIERRLAAECPD